jgi:hypothetical protein
VGTNKDVLFVQRLSAHAQLDASAEALAHAQAESDAGDESWTQWLAEYERGDALIIRLEVTIAYADDVAEEVSASSIGHFVESDTHPPKVERQIAELATGRLILLGRRLASHGHQLDVNELGGMYVHVSLEESLRRRLERRRHSHSR